MVESGSGGRLTSVDPAMEGADPIEAERSKSNGFAHAIAPAEAAPALAQRLLSPIV